MGEKLTERLTIPMTPKMREQVDELADDLGVRAVDVGRMALVAYIEIKSLEAIVHLPPLRPLWPMEEDE